MWIKDKTKKGGYRWVEKAEVEKNNGNEALKKFQEKNK